MPRLLAVICLACSLAWAQPPAQPQPELERLNSLIEELTALKAQVASVETRIDTLLRGLAEQRGALQNKPGFDALKSAAAPDTPDTKKAAVRCAAITANGARCSRAAVEGSRYCKQHQLAHQK